MELQFLGCGSAFNPLLGNTSSYIEIGRHLYLIDAGESVFYKLFTINLKAQRRNNNFYHAYAWGSYWESCFDYFLLLFCAEKKSVSGLSKG